MSYTFIWIALIVAVVDWVAVAKGWRKVEYVAKPAVMVALLAWLWQNSGFSGHLIWFAVGLACSLAGDVFLMLPREQFVPGLVSFLLAHLAYLVGFNPSLPPLHVASLVLLILVALASSAVYRRIAAGLQASGQATLKLPVLVYAIVISLMLLSALFTLVRPEWSALNALLASAGALLFYASDTMLAWNKFVAPIRNSDLWVTVTYHLGQTLIVLGAAAHFLS
jgi:uncharacterized membrane protein YhhN